MKRLIYLPDFKERILSSAQLVANGKLVNQIGEYLRKNLDSIYKVDKKPNEYELYFHVIYQWKDIPGYKREDDSVHDLNVSINLTCYKDKIRVNFIDRSGYGKVLGSWVLSVEKLRDVNTARKIIYEKIVNKLEKLYGVDYDYLF